MSLIQKYIWVVKTIYSAERITLKELNKLWQNNVDLSGGMSLSRQTFDRWKGGILDIFGIIIDCEQRGCYNYFIANPEALRDGEIRMWLLDTYGTVDALSSSLSLHDRIITDDIPSSRNYLTTILEAMKSNSIMRITHKSFGEVRNNTFCVEPYSLKMSSQRWYLLARNIERDVIHLYALDRMERVESMATKFAMPKEFNAREYFSSYLGIVIDDSVPLQRIVLRADKFHKYYMRSLPLHSSQKEIFACEDYADFELYLRPTYDFYMKLMSFGNMVKVLEPASLKNELCKWIRKTLDVYTE